ncbi:MAG: Rha family transcriptional regulator [Shewanella sp.]
MNELITVVNGNPVVTSKQVADHFGKIHRNVMRDIVSELKTAGNFGLLNFEQSSYTSDQNKTLPCYVMTRDGFSLLAMRFTGEKAQQWKIKYIEAFNAMERELLIGSAKFGSVMDALNEACKLMQDDKEKASVFGSGLCEWRKVRKEHMERVNKLQEDVQLLLNFK